MQVEIPGYNLFRCDRGARIGGGVLLYVHEKLPITNVQTYDDKFCQAVICTSELQKSFICVIYRPPECPVTSFRSCLDFIDQYISDGNSTYQLSLLGDLNLPIIGWSSNIIHPGGSSCSVESASLLLDFMSENLCNQFINEPTRLSNTLDLYISNGENHVSHVSTSETPLSDHRKVEILLSYNPCALSPPAPPDFIEESFRSLDFSKADFVKINETLSEINWVNLMESCSDENFPELFNSTLLQACQQGCPKKAPPKGKSNSVVQTISRKKRKLQQQLHEAENSVNCPSSRIESLRQKIASAHIDIRDAINDELLYRETQAAEKLKSNPKYFYSYAKKFSRKKTNINLLFDKDGNIKSNPKDIANLLQNQFSSVFSDPRKTNIKNASFAPPTIKHPFNDDMLDFTEQDIMKAIDEIKPNAASGPDEIPVILLKNCKESLAKPIHLLWSRSMEKGDVPDFYKFSHVFPLHKKDSRAFAANYRPISLTSHVVKVFERVLRKKMVDYLELNDLICSKQHGFRSGRSCLTQLLHHFDDVLEALTQNSDFDSIYLDYAKAFDKVDHKLLVKKLTLYGIHPKIVKWIESFLTNRTQSVVVDGTFSLLALIISGVPQGTVLGPILFLLFINDIEHCIIHSIVRCFADDTRISIAVKSELDVLLLQSDLENVMRWSERNNMALHRDKFEYMCHTSNKRHMLSELPFVSECYQYRVSNDITLQPVNQLRDLGVLVSKDLSWSPHINSIANKARQKASWVLSVFHTRSTAIMLTLYKSMVRSLLEYCCPLWHPIKVSDIQELESVQRTFTSKIAGMKQLHYWERLSRLSLMSLQRRRERFIILHYMWKILNGKTSNDLEVSFVSRPRLGNLAVVPPKSKTSSAANQTLFDSSFAVQGPILWNAMPHHLNTIQDLEQFKSKLTQFLLSIPDKPPIRGWNPPNRNTLLCWKNERGFTSLWGGQRI